MNNDIEHIEYHQSAVLEHTILKIGELLSHSLNDANREDELAALRELIGEVSLLASAYSLKTGRLREDLGVSLREAVSLKLSATRKDANRVDGEWRHYAADAQVIIDYYLSNGKH